MFRLTIETDNAAFAEDSATEEVARILEDAAKRLRDGVRTSTLRDSNGNTVGQFSLTVEGE